MRSPDYTRLVRYLPAVYQDDAVSLAQLDAFLGLADELNHAYLERLEDLAGTLGPDAALRWPVDLPLDAGGDALIDAYLAVYDEVAAWLSITFPPSWGRDAAGVRQRRTLLARAARIWRRRGTPRGFLDWFCLAFGVAAADRPYLLEHFKIAAPQIPDPELTATLFVRSTPTLAGYRRRQEVVEFVRWYAPAHVRVRVCWTRPDFVVPAPPEPPPPGASAAALAEYGNELAAYRADLRALLCSITTFVAHADGVRIGECVDEGRTVDRLDVGVLPSDSNP